MKCNHDDCTTAYCPSCGVKMPVLTNNQKLATQLHEMFCTVVLSCRWRHEKTWNGVSHVQYLQLAAEIHKSYTGSDIVVFISMQKLIKEHGL